MPPLCIEGEAPRNKGPGNHVPTSGSDRPVGPGHPPARSCSKQPRRRLIRRRRVSSNPTLLQEADDVAGQSSFKGSASPGTRSKMTLASTMSTTSSAKRKCRSTPLGYATLPRASRQGWTQAVADVSWSATTVRSAGAPRRGRPIRGGSVSWRGTCPRLPLRRRAGPRRRRRRP